MRIDVSAYKAVFFDAGDTLVTIPAAHEIMQAYLSERRFPHNSDKLKRLLHEAITHFYYHKKDYSNDICTPESDRAFWVRIYRFILERLSDKDNWPDAQLSDICHELYDVFVDPQYYTLFDDVAETVERLREANIRMGIISNFAPTLKEIFRRYGLLESFDPFIVSTEAGLEKPNPAIFSLALKRSGLEAHEVLYVGDHEINDIWAPAQVGMKAIRIIRYENMAGEGIRSLSELIG